MNTTIKYYLVSVDRCDHRAIKDLSKEEREYVYCYAVNPARPKLIAPSFQQINEWELSWHDNRYQTLQYYEYGTIVHAVKNPELIEGLSHVGLLHYDVRFLPNAVNDMQARVDANPKTIFYNTLRRKDTLYFTPEQLRHICDFMSEKLGMDIDHREIWDGQWMSEALSVTPVDVFSKFGQYILDNQYEFESMLNNNRWGLMDRVKHRLCGFTERMWGIYIMSHRKLGYELEPMPVVHEQEAYEHLHLKDKQNFLGQFGL